MPTPDPLRDLLIRLHGRAGVTYTALASACAVSVPSAWKWFNEDGSRPSIANLRTVLDVLGATADEQREAWAAMGVPDDVLAPADSAPGAA